MRIAMIGQKGVPALHGGVERHVEELGSRLVGLGHEVTVYTRPNYTPRETAEHRGMRLVSLPTVGTKHLDAIIHSGLATCAALAQGFDVIHYHAIGPTLWAPLARLRSRGVVSTIHGQDWKRGKWGRIAASVLRIAEWVALHVPDQTVVVSESLTATYRERGARNVVYVPNGVSIEAECDDSVLLEYSLRDGGFILFAGRLVPEKGLHHLINAHAQSGVALPLVVAGDDSHSSRYIDELRRSVRSDIRFVGYQYGPRLAALFRHSGLFVLPSDLEGLPIVLLEALAYGAPVLASDIAPNVEVLGSEGRYFRAGDVESLASRLTAAMASLPELRVAAAEHASRAVMEYDWDQIVVETVEVYWHAVHSRRR